MIRALLLVSLVACYSPSYKDCDVTCSGGTCPAGYRCEQGLCRAPGFSGACGQMSDDGSMQQTDAMIDGNPNLDSDGDTVMDNVDNCILKANPLQENEDGDARGDACDPCPPLTQFINPTTLVVEDADLDMDSDGVGNGCDILFMNSPGDRIVYFEGFRATMPPPLSVIDGPAWTFANGLARVNAGSQAATLRLTSVQIMPPRREIIHTSLTVNSVVGGTSMIRGGGPIDSADGVRAAGCYWGANTSGQQAMALIDIQGPSQDIQMQVQTFPGQFMPPATTRIMLMRDPGNTRYTCQADNEPPLTGSFGPAPQGNVGLRVRSSDVSFDWILVVDRPN